MLDANEAMANIQRDDEQKTKNKQAVVERTLDLLARRVALDEQLTAVRQTLTSAVSELQKLMSLDEFARHSGLSKSEKALLQDLEQSPRGKPRANMPATAPSLRHSGQRNSAQDHSAAHDLRPAASSATTNAQPSAART